MLNVQVVDEAAVSGVTVIFSNCAYSLKRKLIDCNLLEVRPHTPPGQPRNHPHTYPMLLHNLHNNNIDGMRSSLYIHSLLSVCVCVCPRAWAARW